MIPETATKSRRWSREWHPRKATKTRQWSKAWHPRKTTKAGERPSWRELSGRVVSTNILKRTLAAESKAAEVDNSESLVISQLKQG